MSWIKLPSFEEAREPLKEFWTWYRKRSSGSIANIMRIQALNPKALKAHYELYQSIMFGASSLSRKERELAAVVVSKANDCHY